MIFDFLHLIFAICPLWRRTLLPCVIFIMAASLGACQSAAPPPAQQSQLASDASTHCYPVLLKLCSMIEAGSHTTDPAFKAALNDAPLQCQESLNTALSSIAPHSSLADCAIVVLDSTQ